MGGVVSWLRGGNGNGLSERKKAMGTVKGKILDCKEELRGFKGSHQRVVSLLLKALFALETVFIAWAWVGYTSGEDRWVAIARIAPTTLGWPLFCWVFKRYIVDWYYRMRIRRGESRLEALYEEQKKILKEIENDPEFQERMELLKQFGKEVPGYKAPFQPEAAVVAGVVPTKPQPPMGSGDGMINRTPSKQKETHSVPSTPAGTKEPAGTAPPPNTPASPILYVQPVSKPPPVLGRKHAVQSSPAVDHQGSFFSRLVDLLVGEGVQLSIPLDCSCGVNNGLISKEDALQKGSFVCSSCQKDNKISIK